MSIYPSYVCHALKSRKPYFKKQKPSSAPPRNHKEREAPPPARAKRGQQRTSTIETLLILCQTLFSIFTLYVKPFYKFTSSYSNLFPYITLYAMTRCPSYVCHALKSRKPYFKKQKPSSAPPRHHKGRGAPAPSREKRGQQRTSTHETKLTPCLTLLHVDNLY